MLDKQINAYLILPIKHRDDNNNLPSRLILSGSGIIEIGTLGVQFDYNFTQGRKVSDTATTTLKNHTM